MSVIYHLQLVTTHITLSYAKLRQVPHHNVA